MLDPIEGPKRALPQAHSETLVGLAVLLTGSRVLAERVVTNAASLRPLAGGVAIDVEDDLERAVISACRRLRRPEGRGPHVIETYRSAFLDDDYDGAEFLEMLTLLPRRERFAVVLRFYSDRDEAEIATALHCTVPTARRLVARGMMRLRRMMPDE